MSTGELDARGGHGGHGGHELRDTVAEPLVTAPTEALPPIESSTGLLSWLASVDHK